MAAAAGGDAAWLVSRRIGVRGFWGLAGMALFGWVTLVATTAAARDPQADSVVLALITATFFVATCVFAWEGLSSGLVRLDAAGYRTSLGPRRPWADVLAVGVGQVDGREVPVVALRSPDGGSGVTQDALAGFADEEAQRLVEALRARVPDAPGFAGVAVSPSWWAEVDAEADRAASVVLAACGREPVARERVALGYPGLVNAVRLDYGLNDAGEGVELLVRERVDLAVVKDGRRWLRQERRRAGDPAAQVCALFGEHTTDVVPAQGAGFDVLRVDVGARRPIQFNAEEPDRF